MLSAAPVEVTVTPDAAPVVSATEIAASIDYEKLAFAIVDEITNRFVLSKQHA